jgi:hypothetical protein
MKRHGRSAFRRTAYVGAGVATASLLTFALTAPGAAAPGQADTFSPGTGNAVALAYTVNPVFGNLSFGITAGESVAGHQNTGATAQSNAVNLGVIGVTLAGEGCEGAPPVLAAERQPQPVTARTGEPGAAEGQTDTLGEAIRMSARATDRPFAEAITRIDPIGGNEGLSVSGGTTTASSGVAGEGVRRARAVAEIPAVELFGGVVTLEGLRWEALQESGAITTNHGSFDLAAVNVAGTAIPLPSDPLQRLDALQDVLGALGLTITPPATRAEQGIVVVEPLRIGIVPSRARDTLVQSVLQAASPARNALTQLIAELGCGSENDLFGNTGHTAITLLDIALGSVSGAGAVTVELGGVSATTGEIVGFGGLGQAPALPDLGGAADLGSGVGLAPGAGTGAAFSGGTTTPDLGGSGGGGGAASEVPAGTTASQPIADVDGERGGILLGVAAAGLALLLLTAEVDRRKMLRAQREIPLEA